MATTREILNAIADEKALSLFDVMAVAEYHSDKLMTMVGMSRKEFYSRIFRLVKAGLASRQRGKYSLTVLGKIVHQSKLAIDRAVEIYLNLKAVDVLIRTSEIPEAERNKVINFLLPDEASKNIFLQRSMRQE